MRRKTRTKVKKGFVIAGIVVGILAVILLIILVVKINKKELISYNDGIVCKNYFKEIKIDLNKKEVTRDNIHSSLMEEFEITEDVQNLAFSSDEEMRNFLSNSVFEITQNDSIYTITNKFQTKNIIVKAEDIKEKVDGEEIIKISDNLYILSFYSEKLTKAMYNYYSNQNYIEKVFYDEVFIDEPIQDISQTMYGQTQIELNNYHCLGVTSMGLDNYQKIVYDNGNPQNITIATVGYGANIQNEIFNNRINEEYYNYISNNKDIQETVPQGSRILEVLADSTTSNVKLMPIVTVNEEGYVTISAIIKGIAHAIDKTDVICYELINMQNEAIDLVLEEAFRRNIPVVCTTSTETNNYPAEHGMTIAVSSIDRNEVFADYSGKGDFIDFTAPSTDVEEIFKSTSTVSRWSGASYSNAQITSAIAMIKTYNKSATILDVYNFLRNFCVDIGGDGKDEQYGYGFPKFQNLSISDIDKQQPEFKEIIFENETWQTKKEVKIMAKDNIRIRAFAVTQSENIPEEAEWNVLETVTPDLDETAEITENGIYYIWLQDSAGNTKNERISIEKVDNKPPTITYAINKDTIESGYVTITVSAEDTESGLYDSPFSWDNTIWSMENSTKTITENGRYKVYAVDNIANVGELEIVVDCFPAVGTYELGEGNIITSMEVPANWTEDTNNSVKIQINPEIDILSYQITSNPYAPQEFIVVRTIRQEANNTHASNTQANNVAQNNTTQNSTNANTTNTAIANQNTSNQNISNQNTSSANITHANTTNENNINARNTTVQYEQLNEPIVITKALDVNTIYYIWVKDVNGNIRYQTFSIAKATY